MRFCRNLLFWNMIRVSSWVFDFFWKNEISGDLGAENAADILMGDYGFCSKSGVQNVGNLDFSNSLESVEFQLHHISEWANSERISKIWFILKSELGLRFFRFLENEKNLGDMRMDLAGTWKMSRKKLIFFSVRKHFLNFPKLIFYRFPTNLSHSNLRPIRVLVFSDSCLLPTPGAFFLSQLPKIIENFQ